MGQSVRIVKDEDDWLYVQTWDTYLGWIQNQWISRTASSPKKIVTVRSLFTDALKTPDPDSEIWTKLVITTTLELVGMQNGFAHVRLPDGNDAWIIGSDVHDRPVLEPTGTDLVLTAKRFLGVPYLWGGTTPFGLDCSGFMQLVYKINGMDLLRDAHMQANDPEAIPVEKSDLVHGDLVFFASSEKITHVGMACGDGMFIHAAGDGIGVTISRLDDEPYASNYVCGRRVLRRY